MPRSAAPPRHRHLPGARTTVLALAAMLFLLVGCDATQWAQRGAGSGHGYFSSAESSLTPSTVATLHVDYQGQLPVVASGDPIVLNGTVFVAGVDGSSGTSTATVAARATGTGAVVWDTTLPGVVSDVTDVATDGSSVFVAAHHDDGSVDVLALAPDTGAARWATISIPAPSADGWTSVSPVLTVVGNRLVLSGEVTDGTPEALAHQQVVLALDVTTGAVAWNQQRTVRDPRSSRVVGVAGGNVAWTYEDAASDTTSDPAYVTTVLSSTDGSVVWSHDGAVGDAVIAAAAADGNRLVGDLGAAAQPTDSGGVLDASAGTVVWQGAPSLTPPLVVTATTAIWPVVDADGVASALRAYALADGSGGWTIDLPVGSRAVTASVAGSVLYVVADAVTGRTLQTYDVGSGQSISTVTLAEGDQSEVTVGSPIVVSGRVWVVAGDQLVSLVR
jgi:hypothetical protein